MERRWDNSVTQISSDRNGVFVDPVCDKAQPATKWHGLVGLVHGLSHYG